MQHRHHATPPSTPSDAESAIHRCVFPCTQIPFNLIQHLHPSSKKAQLELTRSNVLITPNSCSVIATSGCEEVARRARCDRDNRVLVSLEHHLSMSRVWIPELYAPIFGAAHHPFSARCQAHAKYVVLKLKVSKGKHQRKQGHEPCGLRTS